MEDEGEEEAEAKGEDEGEDKKGRSTCILASVRMKGRSTCILASVRPILMASSSLVKTSG